MMLSKWTIWLWKLWYRQYTHEYHGEYFCWKLQWINGWIHWNHHTKWCHKCKKHAQRLWSNLYSTDKLYSQFFLWALKFWWSMCSDSRLMYIMNSYMTYCSKLWWNRYMDMSGLIWWNRCKLHIQSTSMHDEWIMWYCSRNSNIYISSRELVCGWNKIQYRYNLR